jgi:plastocyanin
MTPRVAGAAIVSFLIVAPQGQTAQIAADLHGTARIDARPAENVVVWLEAPGAMAAPRGTAVLDQRNLTFSPQVLAVQVGTTVAFPNSDRVFHNVFSFKDGKTFDLGIYPVGATRLVTFDRPGLSRIFCNIHPNMAAYVMAVDTPYFAVSGEDGSFAIPGVPAGAYTYQAWHPGMRTLSGQWRSDEGPLQIEWP